jgi:DNA-directed RNA polymerase subunit RPC12/RpoP
MKNCETCGKRVLIPAASHHRNNPNYKPDGKARCQECEDTILIEEARAVAAAKGKGICLKCGDTMPTEKDGLCRDCNENPNTFNNH